MKIFVRKCIVHITMITIYESFYIVWWVCKNKSIFIWSGTAIYVNRFMFCSKTFKSFSKMLVKKRRFNI